MEVLQAPLDKKKIELNDAYMSAWKVRGHLGEVTQTATMAIEGFLDSSFVFIEQHTKCRWAFTNAETQRCEISLHVRIY